ncbi:MAG: hypothetical protein S4CHLAM123_03130 [Chlamydiales bacterium]|nr:hypothetical protein [Chlamydiales bacterium]
MTDALDIRKQLIRVAKEVKRSSQEILQYYAMERFLYRLSVSDYNNRFILKGGLLFTAWSFNDFRVTQDIDLLGLTQNQPENIAQICKELCSFDAQDGIVFDPTTIATSIIRPENDCQGVQVKFKGILGPTKLHMRIDIGFADAVYPKPTAFVFPTILELSAPRLLGYTQESVVAEKVDAMLQLGELNSRMKDFYDVWYLAHRISFKMSTLTEALKATLATRKTEVPARPHIFEPSFWTNAIKQEQWKNFCRQNRFEGMPEFPQLMAELEKFLRPVLVEMIGGQNGNIKWSSGLFKWNL